MPRTPFNGVRISWLILARNFDFTSLAIRACSAAAAASAVRLETSFSRLSLKLDSSAFFFPNASLERRTFSLATASCPMVPLRAALAPSKSAFALRAVCKERKMLIDPTALIRKPMRIAPTSRFPVNFSRSKNSWDWLAPRLLARFSISSRSSRAFCVLSTICRKWNAFSAFVKLER